MRDELTLIQMRWSSKRLDNIFLSFTQITAIPKPALKNLLIKLYRIELTYSIYFKYLYDIVIVVGGVDSGDG